MRGQRERLFAVGRFRKAVLNVAIGRGLLGLHAFARLATGIDRNPFSGRSQLWSLG